MKTLTVAEVARKFLRVLDDVEREQEEVILIRKDRRVARLVPEPTAQTALEVFGDLVGMLDQKTADSLSKSIQTGRKGKYGSLTELRNPWAT